MSFSQEPTGNTQRHTRVLQVDASKMGQFIFEDPNDLFLGEWKIQLSDRSRDAINLQEAASLLQTSNLPVAFPTETVYGLGADATRSLAVRGIYDAKQRPSDNPLIIHISSLSQIRKLLSTYVESDPMVGSDQDAIPSIYLPLIARFWPGPLTILLPLPTPSPLAAEVTNSLPTVAVRMPSSKLALALIHLAGTPLAAPSANASSRPSPTTASHVLHDLSGRIDLILDGGPCEVGVESTVVDGLTNPPVILRPGGVSIEMVRDTPGWADVRVAYKDGTESGVPRAPGMKYKHYSPNARVLLFHGAMNADVARKYIGNSGSVGILTTENWGLGWLQEQSDISEYGGTINTNGAVNQENGMISSAEDTARLMKAPAGHVAPPSTQHFRIQSGNQEIPNVQVYTIALGTDTVEIARGLFSALRELDGKGVDVILIEGIEDREGGAGAAIMNRLRKAAELEIKL